MATIGRLAVLIDADSTGLKTGLKGAVNETEDSSKKIIKSVQAIATAFAGYLTVDLFTGMVKGAAAAGREIDQLSKLSATSATEFQRQAYATQQLGISNEKLADIFKDVQDKIGDFMQTGAGPMADFFEQIAPKVGVTADQFRNLGGPDALQLYVSSLEKANLSQNEMTFYLEAIASDSALLLPLLKNNGKAMKEMGDEAERLGAVLDDKTIKANVEFAKRLDQLQASAKSASMAVGSELIPALNQIVEAFSSAESGTNSFAKSLGSGLGVALQSAIVLATNTAYVLKTLGDTAGAYGAVSAALARGDIAGAKAIGAAYKEMSEERRQALDDFEKRVMTPVQSPVVGGGSGQRMGMNDPRIIGTPAAGETAGFRPVVTPKPTGGGGDADKAADDAMKKAQEVEAFFAQIGEKTRQREIDGLTTFMDGLKTREEARLQSGMNEQALAEETYKTEYDKLIEAKELLGLTEEEFSARLLQIRMDRDTSIMDADIAMLEHEKQVAAERVRINQQAEKLILDAKSNATQAAIGLLNALGGKSKGAAIAAIALGKAVAIADIIRHTAVAQMHAMAQLGPIAGPAAAAKIGVMGKIQAGLVAATGLVQAGSVGGGNGSSVSMPSSGSSSSQSSASGAPAAPSMNQTVTIQGVSSGDLFSGDAVRTLIDKLIDAQRNGARIVLA